jgi:hypothetical protein
MAGLTIRTTRPGLNPPYSITFEHVPELGELVNIPAPHETANDEAPPIILLRPLGPMSFFRIKPHAANLMHFEFFKVKTHPASNYY